MELLAPLLETYHHLLKVVLAGFGQPDISSHKGRPQRAARDPDKRGLEAVGQADCEFNSSFRIVLDVDVHHQRRQGHRIFLLALIDDDSDRPFHILARHQCSPACDQNLRMPQCDNMQQTGLDARSSCVTPPKIHSPNRLCP